VSYPEQKPKSALLIFGVLVGAIYGVVIRLAAGTHISGKYLEVISIACLFLGPFAVGFITVFIAERGGRRRLWTWLLLPWIPVTIGSLTTMLLYIEGTICVVMFLPIGLALATLGGVTAGIVGRVTKSPAPQMTTLACVTILPFIFWPIEAQIQPLNATRVVNTSIDIAAPPETVWTKIERVAPIQDSELPHAWTTTIGFPKPDRATLSFEGVGGVRHATFKGGVLFIETIDQWEPGRRLAFAIHPEQIPSGTLDEHVTVGGQYFDVLRGEYTLEPLPNGTRLHLSSQHRISTRFNWYSQLWTDPAMRDIQRSILFVIKHRCERNQ